jgi:hypothetical protein
MPGLIEKIPYLQQLGITAVELLPVFAFDAQAAPARAEQPLGLPAHQRAGSPPGLCQPAAIRWRPSMSSAIW